MAMVVTGFGPFGEHSTNASWEAVRLLPQICTDLKIPVKVEEIPVEYAWVQNQPESRWKDAAFTVHVGVSGRDSVVTLECGAHNIGYCKPDIESSCPQGECCVNGADEEASTCLNMEEMLEQVSQAGSETGLEFQLSKDAGRYLCDFVYYKALHCSAGRALFIHVPPLNKPYSANQLAEAIAIVLKTITKMIAN